MPPSRLLLPGALAVSSAGNFVVVWLVARHVPADQFVLFTLWLSVAQVLTVLAFDWVRTAYIRFSGGSEEDRAGIQFLYVVVALVVTVTLGLAIVLQAWTPWGYLLVAVLGQAAFDLAQAANRVTLSDRAFVTLACMRSLLGIGLVFVASAVDETYGAQLLAVGCAMLVPAVVGMVSWTRFQRWTAPVLPRQRIWELARFGTAVSLANVSYFATQAAIRGMAVTYLPQDGLAGRLLALEYAQRIFMNAGLAANLVLLQDGIRKVQAGGRGEAPTVLRRQLLIMSIILLPLWLFFVFGSSWLAIFLAPADMKQEFGASAPLLATACALFSLRTYAIDVAFVLDSDRRGAYAGGSVGFLTTAGVFFALRAVASSMTLEGALLAGATASCIVSGAIIARGWSR